MKFVVSLFFLFFFFNLKNIDFLIGIIYYATRVRIEVAFFNFCRNLLCRTIIFVCFLVFPIFYRLSRLQKIIRTLWKIDARKTEHKLTLF